MKQRLQYCIQIRYVFHFVIRFKSLADFCDSHKKYGVNLHAIFSGFVVFLVLCTICEKSARGYSDLRCVVRDGGHIYICDPRYWDSGCWYPWNQNSKFMSILCARQCLQNTSARPKEKFKREFERHGANIEDDSDFIHPPNVRLTCVGPVLFLSPETVNRQR